MWLPFIVNFRKFIGIQIFKIFGSQVCKEQLKKLNKTQNKATTYIPPKNPKTLKNILFSSELDT